MKCKCLRPRAVGGTQPWQCQNCHGIIPVKVQPLAIPEWRNDHKAACSCFDCVLKRVGFTDGQA
jgi:hypothetical protein